jgi:filamentous hemagglutinin family protein
MSRHWRRALLMTSALVPLTFAAATAGPNGASVVGGSATVQGQGTPNVVVNQTSQSAIINWNTFNIGGGETTRINMPNASSVELDRVTGGLGPSQILGSLYSNGRVFLVNPDGILFGAGSRINVGGLLATTHDISNADFMAGRYNFAIPGNPSASIVNQGSITAQTGGFAALVAPGVRNTGTITATLGTIALASGNAFTLDLYGDQLIKLGVNDSIASQVIDVSTGKPLSSLVSNAGTLRANGGKVELTAVAARKVVDSVINNSGVIEANTIGTHNGMIVLGATTGRRKPAGAPTQTVKVSGTLSAAGTSKGTTGGTVVVTGENVELSGATVDAYGASGGGTVLIGGDWGGGHPNTNLVSNPSAYLEPFTVPAASTVSIDPTTTINTSATTTGNGGKVVVWSNDATTFNGTILAEGGMQSGQGGFVETSGHQLTFNGSVDTRAPNGPKGTLLLDPLNATIAASPGNGVITTSSIESALTTGDVVVTTVGTTGSEAGDIIVASSLSWMNASTLTLNAYRDIDINSGVTIANTGAGNLVLRADATGAGIGTINFNGSGKVDFSGSTGTVSIFYNPTDNPAGSGINATSFTSPFDYSPYVIMKGGVANQLTAYMLVNSVYDLQNIQNNLFGNYALGTNINASGISFIPIGNATTAFQGQFFGNSNVINNLTIGSPVADVGLFGDVGGLGVLSDVGLTNVSVIGTAAGDFVGALIGVNSGAVIGVSVSGTVSATSTDTMVGGLVASNYGTIAKSSSTASVGGRGYVDGVDGEIGGLVGVNSGTIKQSYAAGSVRDISNNGSDVGGFVGLNNGAISQSYAVGPVSKIGNTPAGWFTDLGGFVGANQGLITDSYATGSVTFSGTGTNGGIAAFVGTSYFGTIARSYAIGAVTINGVPPTSYGGVAGFLAYDNIGSSITTNSYWDIQTTGQLTSQGGTGLTTSQLKIGLPSGFDPTAWGSNPSINNGYPYLLWTQASSSVASPTVFTPGGSGSPSPTSTPSPCIVQCVIFPQPIPWNQIVFPPGGLEPPPPVISNLSGATSGSNTGVQTPPQAVANTPAASTSPVDVFTVVGSVIEPYWNKNASPPAGIAGSVRGTLTLNITGEASITLQSLSNGTDQGTTQGPEAYQCSALIVQYANKLGITNLTDSNVVDGSGVAQQLATASNGKFDYVSNGSSQPPAIGSVISIGPSGADTAGHVGIVQAITTDKNGDGGFVITLFDQNVRGGWLQVTFTKVGNTYTGSTTQLTGAASTVVGWANPVGF